MTIVSLELFKNQMAPALGAFFIGRITNVPDHRQSNSGLLRQ